VVDEDELVLWSSLEGVPSALAAARGAVDSLLRDRGLRRTTAELATESLLRGAAASGLLEVAEGDRLAAPSPTAALETAAEQLRQGTAPPPALAAARLSSGLLALVPVVRRSPLQAFARLHVLAATGSISDDLLGRPRPEPELARKLQRLAGLLVASTRAPAIAVAGLAHAEMATLAPFASGNALVARALERLLLVARGVDPTSMLVPEAGHLVLEQGYRSALAAYAAGGSAGRRTWLLHVCSAVAEGVAASPLR
jgi:hypothetical protein